MDKHSKPWLKYKSDAPEREYFKAVRKKRHYKWALFWLIIGGHVGAHRFYLWEYKKARRIVFLYLAVNIAGLIAFAEKLENGDEKNCNRFLYVNLATDYRF